jgi:hypothetical protein
LNVLKQPPLCTHADDGENNLGELQELLGDLDFEVAEHVGGEDLERLLAGSDDGSGHNRGS